MEEPKYLHCEYLTTEPNASMLWVERLPDGRLFSLMSMQKPDWNLLPASQYLFGRTSDDDGKTWSKPFLLYDWGYSRTVYCVVGWKSDREGRIHVFTSAIDEKRFDIGRFIGHIEYLRFDSWRGENPYRSDIPVLSRYTGSLNNAVELESGRLVIPFSTLLDKQFVSSTIWSDDHGDTWQASNDVSIVDGESHVESGAVEPVVAEVKPGVLVMLMRTTLFRLWYAVSYDGGESWSQAKSTNIPAPNAPSTLQKLPDGRIFLAWNDGLGHPMADVRYSGARQCLHVAVSDDGLRTIRGGRIIVKKMADDRVDVHNCYPTTAMSGEKEILLRYMEAHGTARTTWEAPQAFLTLLNPDFLDENEVSDNWGEWISDQPKTEAGITLKPTSDKLAHAIVNFPYATKGSITLTTAGTLPEGCRVLLSDSYLDRINFMPTVRAAGYEEVIGTPYAELTPDASGEWKIGWDETSITLTVNGKTAGTIAKRASDGYNHLTVMFRGEGELSLTRFAARAEKMDWNTGITY